MQNAQYLFGIAKGLTALTPAGLAAGTGYASYALVTSIIEKGLIDTSVNVAKGVVGLPAYIYDGLNSDDPAVRGEALVNALAIGAVAKAVTTKVVQVGIAAGSKSVAKIDASSVTSTLPEGYVLNADGTVTGPKGGLLTIAGSTAEGLPIFQRVNGGAYFTVDPATGTQVRSAAPSTLNNPIITLPDGYTANANGTITGPGGGTLTIAGSTANGSPIFQRANGGAYFTVDPVTGAQVPSPAPSTLSGQTPGSIVAASRKASKDAETEVNNDMKGQGLITQDQVSLTVSSTQAVADIALNGVPNGVVKVPAGYVAEDLNGNVLLDKNGNPITSFNLNSKGQAIIEVKTGEAELTSNQSTVYPAVQSGSASGTGAGTNAAKADMNGTLSQTPVIVLRKK